MTWTKRLSALVIVILWPALAQAAGLTQISSGPTLPASCAAGKNLFLKSGSNAGLYWCSAANTWTGPLSSGGSVTSVGLTAPSIFTVGGSPVTASGTLAIAAAGTSGGVPFFASSTTLGTSAALGANLPVIGGGAGTAPSTGTRSGNTTGFATFTGTLNSGHCVQIDASGNFIDAGSGCGGSGTVTHTAGALTAGKLAIGNGSADVTVDANASLDGSGNLTALTYTAGAGGATGYLELYNASNSNKSTIQSGVPAGNLTWTWLANHTAGVIVQDASGVLTSETGITASGTSCTITAITNGRITGATCM